MRRAWDHLDTQITFEHEAIKNIQMFCWKDGFSLYFKGHADTWQYGAVIQNVAQCFCFLQKKRLSLSTSSFK